MADIRIKDLTTPASSTASDDFFAVDGTTNGTRKLNAFSPTFGGNATVTGTLTTNGNVTINSNVGIIGKSGTGTGGNWRFVSDDGTTRWLNGLLGGSGETSYSIYDSANSRSLLTATAAGVVQINQTTASTSTSTGALVIGNGTSGGLGVGGAIVAGGAITTGNDVLDVAIYVPGNTAIRTKDGSSTKLYIDTKTVDGGDIVLRPRAATALTLAAGTGNVSIAATTASTSTSSGALVVSGGVGVAGAVNGANLRAAAGTGSSVSFGYTSETNTGFYLPYANCNQATVNGVSVAAFVAGYNGAVGGMILINNLTTPPNANPSGGGWLYCEGGALKYRGSSGTVTTIANA